MSENKGRVLVVDDNENFRKTLCYNLEEHGYEVKECGEGAGALGLVRKEKFDVVILDIRLPGIGGMDLLALLKKECPDLEVVMITAYGDVRSAVEAMKMGAYDYVLKPFEMDELLITIQKALERRRLISENIELRERIEGKRRFMEIVGESPKMQRIYEIISRAAETESPVLIYGETGTGKELVARAIHNSGPRRKGPFVAVNCGAIVEGLMESELFGYVKGAFTGATHNHKGLFCAADTGTLFLDEITEIKPQLQAKLLRALQERKVMPVGANHEVKVNIRVISATNRRPDEAIRDGSLRWDLFYRLNVISIFMPPLRERKEDIELLLGHFIKFFNNQKEKEKIEGISRDALRYLKRYNWPGNVRELRNVVERWFVFGVSGIVEVKDLPQEILNFKPTEISEPSYTEKIPTIEEAEKELILRALKATDYNKSLVSKILGISRGKLYRKMQRYGLEFYYS
jgi:DNA-binding NtrC family response regulator